MIAGDWGGALADWGGLGGLRVGGWVGGLLESGWVGWGGGEVQHKGACVKEVDRDVLEEGLTWCL